MTMTEGQSRGGDRGRRPVPDHRRVRPHRLPAREDVQVEVNGTAYTLTDEFRRCGHPKRLCQDPGGTGRAAAADGVQ